MTDEEKRALAETIADQLEDSAYGIGTGNDRDLTARLVVDHIEHDLHQLGWMPPAKTERLFGRIHDWMTQSGKIPDHHINRSVLNSHLSELADILHDR